MASSPGVLGAVESASSTGAPSLTAVPFAGHATQAIRVKAVICAVPATFVLCLASSTGGDEQAYILEGKVLITPTGAWAGCKPTEVKAGDFCVFPDGMTCVWDVSEPINKHFNFP